MGIFGKRPKNAAVLGCGPAGMFATHALVEAGWQVTVFSRKQRSQMFGAQYLHRPIPGLPENKQSISYELIGTPAEYRDKVYRGQLQPGEHVSPEVLVGQHDAWDIRVAYFAAYEQYEGLIENASKIDSMWYGLNFHYKNAKAEWGMVISTIPAPALCGNTAHKFYSMKVWAAGDAPELGRMSPISCAPGKVICNGGHDRAWYRVSNVFGHTTVEWPYDRKPPVGGVAEVVKPLWHNCQCHNMKEQGSRGARVPLYRLGRYGAWQKGFLSHQAYEGARRLAEGRGL